MPEDKSDNRSSSLIEQQRIKPESIIEKELTPSIETDNAGFKRKIYRYNGVTFSFRGREEIPIYPSYSEATSTVLGETPRFIDEDEYHDYVNATHKDGSGIPRHYAVTKTVLGVAELATRLGSTDPLLPKVIKDLKEKRYSPEVFELMGQLIACNFVQNNEIVNEPDLDAEALVILGLFGNTAARQVIASRVNRMRILDEQQERPAARPEEEMAQFENISEKDLICVHSTNYRPQQDGNGNYYVITSSDALDSKTVRNSIHVSLNHKVVAHFFGSWNNQPYVILSPFEDMLNSNGNIQVLNPVDTWWVRNPGEPLVFPNATLVVAGGDLGDHLIIEEGKEVKVKSEGFTVKDITSLNQVQVAEGNEYSIFYQLNSTLKDGFLPDIWNLSKVEEYSSYKEAITALRKKLADKLVVGDDPKLVSEHAMNLFNNASAMLHMDEWAWQTIMLSDVPSSLQGIDQEVQSKLLQQVIEKLQENVSSCFYGVFMEYAVEKVMKDRGFKPTWGTGTESGLHLQRLGNKLQVFGGLHQNSYNNVIEKKFINAVNQAYTPESGFRWEQYDTVNVPFVNLYLGDPPELLKELPMKTRRSLYASGLLTARIPQPKQESAFISDWAFDDAESGN